MQIVGLPRWMVNHIWMTAGCG